MSAFGGIHITKQGKQLQSKTMEGKLLKFTKVLIGDGEITGDIEKVTSISNLVETVDINNIAQGKVEGEAIISFIFSNSNMIKPFYWREIALMAIDPDTEEEKVFAYANAGADAEYIPNYLSDLINKKVDLILKIDNIENIVISVASGLYMTKDEFEEEISKHEYKTYTKNISNAITQNTNYELPATYVVGELNMELYMEGILLVKGADYIEVGETGETSNIIQFKNWTVKAGYILVQKVKGQSIRIYSKEEAVEAVKQLWTEEHGNLNGVYVQSSGVDVYKNHIVVVRSSTDTAALAWYTVDRLNLSIEETGG